MAAGLGFEVSGLLSIEFVARLHAVQEPVRFVQADWQAEPERSLE